MARLVEQYHRQAGYPFSVWTCLDMVHHLFSEFQVQVSGEVVRKHLHQLRYRLIQPVLYVKSPDPEYEAKVKQLEACQQQARQGELILLYENEFNLNPLPGVIHC